MAKKMKTLGRNIEFQIDGDTLTIEIDLSQDAGPSNSGKTLIVASSEGNKAIDDTWRIGLNVYKYAEKKKGKK